MKSLWNKYSGVLRFVMVFLLIFLYGMNRNIMAKDYWHDSGIYYEASKTFIVDGHFSWLNYMDLLRGYFFPFILYIFTAVGRLAGAEDGIAVLFGASLLAALIFAIIIPELFEKRKNSLVYTMAMVLVFLAYWQDLIFYPLSDFYAFALLLIAVYLMIKAGEWKRKIKWGVYLIYVLCGICLYGAYNTRTIYLFAGPLIVLLYLFFNRKEEKKQLLILISIVAGVVICGLPQAGINQKLYGNFSIAVDTSNMEGGNLFNFQLSSGITMQRYETYVGSEDRYPKHKFIFEDEAGKQIMEREEKVLVESIGEYISIVIKYPLDFIGLYTRHLLNAFCIPYNHVYIRWLSAFKPWLILVNYTLVFITGMAIALQKSWKLNGVNGQKSVYMLATLLPCLMILPGAIEMRFFAPMYILMYGYLAYAADYALLIRYIKKHKVKILAIYTGILCICLSVWGSALASAECGAQLLSR